MKAVLTKENIEQFHEEGYCITPPMWPDDELRRMQEEFVRLREKYLAEVSWQTKRKPS